MFFWCGCLLVSVALAGWKPGYHQGLLFQREEASGAEGEWLGSTNALPPCSLPWAQAWGFALGFLPALMCFVHLVACRHGLCEQLAASPVCWWGMEAPRGVQALRLPSSSLCSSMSALGSGVLAFIPHYTFKF